MQRRSATPPPGTMPFFDGCACGVHRVFDAGLFLLQFRLRCRANLDDCYASNQLGKPLLEFFLVVV